MTTRVFIPRDSGALCVGADAVANAFREHAKAKGLVDMAATGAG